MMSLRSETKKNTNEQSLPTINSWFKRRRAKHLIELLTHCHQQFGCVDVLDIGGHVRDWDVIPFELFDALNIHVTLINDDDSWEVSQLKNGQLTNDKSQYFNEIKGDGCQLEYFSDYSFHLVYSNSTIEHVGNWPKMQSMAAEIRRLAPYYLVKSPKPEMLVDPKIATSVHEILFPDSTQISDRVLFMENALISMKGSL